MIWLDYNIVSFADGSFTVQGEWPGEVMGVNRDGTFKKNYLYKPGDVFIVDAEGVLRKTDEVNALLLKYESNKTTL